jgi:hypothetical protein
MVPRYLSLVFNGYWPSEQLPGALLVAALNETCKTYETAFWEYSLREPSYKDGDFWMRCVQARCTRGGIIHRFAVLQWLRMCSY